MRPKVILLCLCAIALVAGIAVVGGRHILRGPLEMAARKRQFDALVKTNDHRAVAEAAIAAIRTYTNAQFLHDEVTNLAPAIAALRPSYVVVYPDAVTVELAGGFDHFGFKVEDERDAWEMCWYTEKGRHPLLTLTKHAESGEQHAADGSQPFRPVTIRVSAAAGSHR
jgi:hypothetical protein